MRINKDKIIKRYQVGGSIIYEPLPLPGEGEVPSQAPAQSGGGEESGPLSEALVKDLLGKGLTNDVMAFSQQVNDAYAQYANLPEILKGSAEGQRLRRLMRGDLGQMTELIRNKEQLTRAMEVVNSNDAGSDYAVTERGVIVQNMETGVIAEVSAERYASELAGTGDFKMLTNADLINQREYNPRLVNDTKSLQALNSAKGMRGVTEEVRSILTNLGNLSETNANERYVFNGEVTTGEQLSDAVSAMMGVDGFYKIGSSSSNSSNAKNIEMASEAMWVNLSSNARSLLKARAVQNGVEASQLEEVAKQYAIALLKPSLKEDRDNKSTMSYDKEMSKLVGTGNTSESTGDIGFWQAYLGKSGDIADVMIDDGTGNQLQAKGFKLPGMQAEGKVIGSDTMIRDIQELRAVGDPESYSVGTNIIKRGQLDALMYEGGETAIVEMPSKMVGRSVVPDLDVQNMYNAANDELKNSSEKLRENAIHRAKIYNKHGINTNSRGEPVFPTANFMTFSAKINNFAIEKSHNPDKRIDTSTLQQVGGKEEDSYVHKFQRDANGKKIPGVDLGNFLQDTKVYRGRAYIHVENGPIGARILDRNKIDVDKGVNHINYLSTPNANRKRLNQAQQQSSYSYTPQ